MSLLGPQWGPVWKCSTLFEKVMWSAALIGCAIIFLSIVLAVL